MDWFQTGKGVRQGCILTPRLFNLYTEYIMQDAVLDEVQAGIKISIDKERQQERKLFNSM